MPPIVHMFTSVLVIEYDHGDHVCILLCILSELTHVLRVRGMIWEVAVRHCGSETALREALARGAAKALIAGDKPFVVFPEISFNKTEQFESVGMMVRERTRTCSHSMVSLRASLISRKAN